MRKFICMRDPYTGYGPGEPLSMTIVEAEDLNDLARQLAENGQTYIVKEEENPFELLESTNGDGADYYLIHELFQDGSLSKDPILG